MNDKNFAARTPPMGWNSWDCFETRVNEGQLLEAAQTQARLLLPYNWEYVVCDIQWSAPPTPAGTIGYRSFVPLSLDAWGRQLPDPERFPSSVGGAGFRPIADRVHALGEKFGIHIMRGIPRQAVHARLPVLGTALTADQIANPFSISRWNGDMYGVLPTEGGQAYYDSLFKLYAEWQVDFVKVDDICNTNMYPHNPYSAEREIEMLARAIERCGRPMVLSLSPGPAQIDKAWHMKKYANMWRITDDFWDDWALLKAMFERCEVWQSQSGPGCWPDCDMLPLGWIGEGHENPRRCAFTHDEQRTMMTLWCIVRSPLMMGGDLTALDDWTLALLTNADALHLTLASHGAQQLFRDDRQAAWTTTDDEGRTYLALFNLSDEERIVSAENELPEAYGRYRELWRQAECLQNGCAARLRPHACALIRREN